MEEIARIYGLPLPLLSAPLGQWTRGVNEQVMKMAWRTGVRPHLDRFLGALKTRLLLPGERFEVDPSEFVRGDAGGISDMLTAMQGDAQRNPVASERELRHIAGLPRERMADRAYYKTGVGWLKRAARETGADEETCSRPRRRRLTLSHCNIYIGRDTLPDHNMSDGNAAGEA